MRQLLSASLIILVMSSGVKAQDTIESVDIQSCVTRMELDNEAQNADMDADEIENYCVQSALEN